MMKTLILQNLTHRGTVSAEGFVLSAKLLTEREMRRRILANWQDNAKVLRYGDDLILLLPQSFRVDCLRTIGLPLVRYGDKLSSFPLRKSDLEDFQNSGEMLILLKEGRIQTLLINDLPTESVENWFDVSSFQIVETETLGEVKTKPVIVEKVETINLRDELKSVPEADNEMAEILHILKSKRDEFAKAKSNQTAFGGTGNSGSFADGFSSVFDAFKNLFAAKGGQNWQTSDQSKPPGKLRQMFTKALFQMKIAQMLGRKQAQYLAKMMEKFENGDLDEALKYAIPLEDMQALKEMSEQMPFLGFLRPRDNLQINYGRQAASNSSVHLENQWFENLRQLYRQTFERLVAQNRIEEAAFVLAELLKSNLEAVEFLEKHHKFRLAAELAESRNLAKDIIVRQWFLAGEKRRAVQLAVLHNCFEYVVTKLEQQKNPQAAELREIWAENLAESGNFQAAINTIWKLENKREIAVKWIDKVIEFGGTPAAEMLAKKVVLLPESFEEVKTKLLEIINDAEAADSRAAFAAESLRLTPNDGLRTLLRPLARKILADMAHDNRRFSPPDLRRLVEISNDYTLRTDLPKLIEINTKKDFETLTVEIAENDRGANHVYDAHLLPDGKIVVALGESGVKIISKQGKTIAHFDQPTHKMVVSDFGTKAIGFAHRNDSYRLTKFDFIERRANYWCEAAFLAYSPTFDGNLWFIGLHDEVFAIDTNAKTFEAVWKVSDIGGNVYKVSRSKTKLMLLVNFAGKGFEKWSYDLPSLTLRSRNQTKGWYETDNEKQFLSDISTSAVYTIAVKREFYDEQKFKLDVEVYEYDKKLCKFQLPLDTVGSRPPEMIDNKYFIIKQTKEATIFSFYEIPNKEIAVFKLNGSKFGVARLDQKNLTITDEFGRVIIFDCIEKVLRRNLRF